MIIVSCWGMSVWVQAEGLRCPQGGFFVEAGCLLLKALVQSLVFSLHIGPVSIHTVDQQVFLSIKTLAGGGKKKPRSCEKSLRTAFYL